MIEDVAPPVAPAAPDPGDLQTDARELPVWRETLVPLLETLRGLKLLPSKNAAFHAVNNWLNNKDLNTKGLTMTRSTIYAGLDRHSPTGGPPNSLPDSCRTLAGQYLLKIHETLRVDDQVDSWSLTDECAPGSYRSQIPAEARPFRSL